MKDICMSKYTAHRGLHDEDIPENSLAAFENAAKKGYSIELDVRLSKDGKVVVFHDASLARMCGVNAALKDFSYEELSRFSLNGSSERIPLFKDVLKRIDGRAAILTEIKNCNFGSLERRTFRLLDKYKGCYAVQSFNIFTVLWCRLFRPGVCRGVLLSTHFDRFDFEYIARKITALPVVWRLLGKPDFISVDRRSLSPQLINAAKKAGAALFVWTARDDVQLERAAMVADSVIFENTTPI